MDTKKKKTAWRKSYAGTTHECCTLSWTNPEGTTLHKTTLCWRSKNELTSETFFLCTPAHGRISVGWQAKIYFSQFYADTEYNLEELNWTMNDRVDGERDSRKSVRSVQPDDNDEERNLSTNEMIGLSTSIFFLLDLWSARARVRACVCVCKHMHMYVCMHVCIFEIKVSVHVYLCNYEL